MYWFLCIKEVFVPVDWLIANVGVILIED